MSYNKAMSLMNKGISKPSLFSVALPNRRISREVNDHIDFFCLSTAIPSVSMETAVVPGHENIGIDRDQPVKLIFEKPFRITVIERSDFRIYKEMRNWFNTTGINLNQGTTGGQISANRNTRMAYYNSFVEQMTLTKLEYTEPVGGGQGDDQFVGYKPVLKVNFINVFPKAISTIDLNAASQDEFVTFSVDLMYESYNLEYPEEQGIGVPKSLVQYAFEALQLI